MPKGFDPINGTVANAIATCPVCHSVIGEKEVKNLFREKKSKQKLVAVILKTKNKSGKIYRVATAKDDAVIDAADQLLTDKQKRAYEQTGMDPIPDEIVCTPDGKEYVPGGLFFKHTPFILYGLTKWGDLFGTPQKLAMIVLSDNIRRVAHQTHFYQFMPTLRAVLHFAFVYHGRCSV